MANSKSAAKRARQTSERSMRNRRVLTHLRNLNKRTRSAEGVERGKIPGLVSAIDKAAKRGVIHRNAANRRKSRLARALTAAKK
jgi:small subunit ribosomal protein S20